MPAEEGERGKGPWGGIPRELPALSAATVHLLKSSQVGSQQAVRVEELTKLYLAMMRRRWV